MPKAGWYFSENKCLSREPAGQRLEKAGLWMPQEYGAHPHISAGYLFPPGQCGAMGKQFASDERSNMLGWFRKLLPREDKFFDLFERHSRTVVGGAEALEKLLAGKDVERWAGEIVRLENEADAITAEVLLAVRRSFITPFDRSDIQDLIQSMDDAIDMMHKTVKTVRLFERTEFDPLMQEMGTMIAAAARLVAEAIPLLGKVGQNVPRLTAIAREIKQLEDHSDDVHELGLKDLFHRHSGNDAMSFIVGKEIYSQLEKVVDRFEDVANEISGIVVENV
jgi:predicted phosphate transport protein (TIGR00153 family)